MKTLTMDIGLYGRLALRHLQNHLPITLEAKQIAGTLGIYLQNLDREMPQLIEELYQQTVQNNPLPEQATFQRIAQRNNWAMEMAIHTAVREMILLEPEKDQAERLAMGNLDSETMWNLQMGNLTETEEQEVMDQMNQNN